MKRFVSIVIPLLSIFCLSAERVGATANFVYHEQTNNFVAAPTCPSSGTDTACGRYVENIDRDAAAGFQVYSTETYTLHFKVEFPFYTNQVRVYYTTDGSRPCGAFGGPDGRSCLISNTTQFVVANYTCTYQDTTHNCNVVDVTTATIPAQPAGTTVKYIVSAWHSGGGSEIFADSGTCSGLCPLHLFRRDTRCLPIQRDRAAAAQSDSSGLAKKPRRCRF